MSTRANIVLKERGEKLWFYRHSDGYPSGTLPTLKIFMDWLKTGVIRNDLSQGSGWLIMLGALEYGSIPAFKKEPPSKYTGAEKVILATIEAPKDWKVGAYEPTTGQHGDIEFQYEIDLDKKTLKVFEVEINYETEKTKLIDITEKELV